MEGSEDTGLFVFTIALFAIVTVPVVITLLFGLFQRGKFGKMKTVRHLAHARADVVKVKGFYAKRLRHEGFEHEKTLPDGTLEFRNKPPSKDLIDPAIHSKLKLNCELHVEEDGENVRARVSLQARDFVVYDTGERAYIEALLERIVRGNLAKEPPPVVPNTSSRADTAYLTGFGLMVAPLVMLLPSFDFSMSLSLIFAMGVSALIAVAYGIFGFIDAARFPKEITGHRRGAVGILLAVLAMGYGTGLFFWMYGDDLGKDLNSPPAVMETMEPDEWE